MKRFEKKEEIRSVTHCVERACDICKRTTRWPEGSEWFQNTSYDVCRTTIECEEGQSFPEGRSTETLSFDICPECFRSQLIPFLATLGAVPTKRTSH